MSINSALVDLRLPAGPTTTGGENKVFAVIRRLAAHHPRWARERPYLDIGDSYRISDGRRVHEGESNWVHTQGRAANGP